MTARLLVPFVLGLALVVLGALLVQARAVAVELRAAGASRLRAGAVAVVGVVLGCAPWALTTWRLYRAGRLEVPPWRLSLGSLRGAAILWGLRGLRPDAPAPVSAVADLTGEALA